VRMIAGTAILVAILSGCSSSSSPTEPPPMPPPVITFQPAGAFGEEALFLGEAAGATTESITLLLQSRNVTGLYGIAFNLIYPANLLALVSVEEDEFLSGEPTSFQVDTSQLGRAIVGLTRLGDVDGQDGSGTLITIVFSKVAAGSGTISFERTQAVGSQGEDRFEITWSGGGVVVP
jgi:hypothetical protein